MELSRSDARRFLARYHFAPGTVADVFRHLGSVQYDPLNPLGRNVDLVLQSRVPGYRVGGWEAVAYRDRLVIDCWDKKACLALASDWPYRYPYHDDFRRRWDKRVFARHGEVVEATLNELRYGGPRTSLDFDDRRSVDEWRGSWYGPKLVKNVLRALWDSGRVATHHRVGGRHAYHLAVEVVPTSYFEFPRPTREAALRHLIRRRIGSMGLLRSVADSGLWSLPCTRFERMGLVAEMVSETELVEVRIGGTTYLATGDPRPLLDEARTPDRVRFVAPLDSLIWDRWSVRHLFGFDYVWEVYKPQERRRWGYYVLPVLFGEQFVARFDGRFSGGVWTVAAWYWEESRPGQAVLIALEDAVASFAGYLGASHLNLPKGMDPATRRAFRAGFARRGDP